MELEKFTKDLIDDKEKWNWKLFNIAFLPLLPSLILFISIEINKNFFEDHQWINQVLFYIFTPIILWTLFAGQKNSLVGDYGETILLLIPTFIWLLPGHKSAISWIIVFAFIIVVISLVLYFSSFGLKIFKKDNENITIKKTSHVFIRLAFVFSSVVSTLVISIILIHWADYSMHWGYQYDNNGNLLLDVTGSIDKDFTQATYITFISITTFLVALLLVSLGLLSSFNKNFENQNDISTKHAILSKIKPYKRTLLDKTKIIKLPKKYRKKK